MELIYWQISTLFSLLLCAMYYGQARYWYAKAITIDEERNEDGWANEAKFWRVHFDQKAAEFIEDLGN